MPYIVKPTGNSPALSCPADIDNVIDAIDYYAYHGAGIRMAGTTGPGGTQSFWQGKDGTYHVTYTDARGKVIGTVSARVEYTRK